MRLDVECPFSLAFPLQQFFNFHCVKDVTYCPRMAVYCVIYALFIYHGFIPNYEVVVMLALHCRQCMFGMLPAERSNLDV